MINRSTECRKLAAIMFTDMVGYSALSQRNEPLALELLEEHRLIVRDILPKHGGREVKTTGDGFMIEFHSALAAVQGAVAVQQALHERNQIQPAEGQIRIRIGIHVGDVVARDGDIHGDGVNIAARLEPLAPAGGICVSNAVHEQVRNKLSQPMAELGQAELKNIELPMVVYRVVLPWENAAKDSKPPLQQRGGKQLWRIVLPMSAIGILALLVWWRPWRWSSSSSLTGANLSAASASADAALQPLSRAREIAIKGGDASRDEMKLALTLCQGVIDRNTADAAAWALLARLNCGLYENYDRTTERLSAAQAAAKTALTLAPNSAAAQFAQASVYLVQPATFRQGLELLRKLELAAPNDADVLVALGNGLNAGAIFFGDQPAAPEALKLFGRALALRPGDPMALVGTAESLLALDRNEEADAVLADAIRRTGSPTALLVRFWFAYMIHQNPEEAKALLAQFPPDFVFNDLAVRMVAEFWLAQHEPAKALAYLQPFPREFLENFFDDNPKGIYVGWAHEQAGDTAAAQLAWRNALESVNRKLATQPLDQAKLISYKARLHFHLGETNEAARQAELYLQLTKQAPNRSTLLEALNLTMALGREKDAAAVSESFRKMLGSSAYSLVDLRNRLKHYVDEKPAGYAPAPEFQRELNLLETEIEAAAKSSSTNAPPGATAPPEKLGPNK